MPRAMDVVGEYQELGRVKLVPDSKYRVVKSRALTVLQAIHACHCERRYTNILQLDMLPQLLRAIDQYAPK
jgi:hypothetical protein